MKYKKGTKMRVVENNGHNFKMGAVVTVDSHDEETCKGYCEDRGYIDTQYVSFGVEVVVLNMENI